MYVERCCYLFITVKLSTSFVAVFFFFSLIVYFRSAFKKYWAIVLASTKQTNDLCVEDTSLTCFYHKSLFCIYSGNDVSSGTPLWRHAHPLFCSHSSNDVTIKIMLMMVMLCKHIFFSPFTILFTWKPSVASGRATLARTGRERRSRT